MNLCRIQHHDSQKVKYICLDQRCNQDQKIGCADCFLELHVPNDIISHQRKLISEFEAELKIKIQNLTAISISPNLHNTESVDQEFDTCMDKFIQKLTNYKEQIKEEINNEKKEFVTQVNEFNQKITEQIDLQNTQISQLSTNEINKSISFYQNSNNIILDLKKDYQHIEIHQNKLDLKKQKAVKKLRITFEQIMKELDENIKNYSSKNSNTNNDNNNVSYTPEKQIQPSQLSNTTQSTPTKNIVDVVRSKKQRKGKN